MKRNAFTLVIVILSMTVLVFAAGCSQTNQQAVAGTTGASATASNSGSVASDAAEAENFDSCEVAGASEMPEYDFSMDEGAYLTKTYNLKTADSLDLISRDQLLWLALNKGRSAVAITDASDKHSAEMLAEAQKAAKLMKATVYVYEPTRNAADGNLNALASSLAKDGIANLESLKTNSIITLSKLTVDKEGNPAPVTAVTTDLAGVSDAVKDAYSLACCG